MTNVGNEHRQILMSVLTCGEGSHLAQRMDGLVAEKVLRDSIRGAKDQGRDTTNTKTSRT